MALGFCSVNGYLQSAHLFRWAIFGPDEIFRAHFILGVITFFIGMIINIHSDSILRNLRKPGEKDYKIPKGGMFNHVSGANFFGEILEWWGFALAASSLPALAFAIFTTCNIGPRACQHHRWYLEKFEDYPKSRKALIPFIL
ncbi:3-oxo-5-alpha-steroid 4-dehydrogenase 1-like isoform X2 [Gigantopelta aegis]|nr:3-oxo-5-alpha-steroid 4-dehydrogenase 1-like isoform X2 [Gigantopelta aegis]XP_041355116.1 3-oxo-5-alpha-steroid 4-dehydrogenase 1-like isoform X2 [Gigantopelta aegis]XP_041355117.1 3-oxo-5-alpha-steroid 4-dehydrogenase 1-like isoform X2 [Gigantopelta aegis]